MHAQPRKRAEWLELVSRLEESEKKALEFATEHGLHAKTLEWWRARFRREGAIASKASTSRQHHGRRGVSAQASGVRLARVTVTSAASQSEALGTHDMPGVTLEVGRVRVLVPRGFHRATLAAVLALLGIEEAR